MSTLHGTGKVDERRARSGDRQDRELGGLTPRGIRTHLASTSRSTARRAAYGHFGRKPDRAGLTLRPFSKGAAC
jgi:S-adenosylmethionine synthetase